MQSPTAKRTIIITKEYWLQSVLSFCLLLFTIIILTATDQIVNHLTKIFYKAIPGRRRAARRSTYLTYFTRLYMLNYMLIILIEQQLNISIIYLIYNSKIVTRRQTQHDLKVDQGCPSAIFCLLSQIVQTDFSNRPSIWPSTSNRKSSLESLYMTINSW